MTKEAIHLEDFPPFVRFELEEHFRRKIFAQFVNTVSDVAVDIVPSEFWRSVEEEFGQSRYELIFGSVRGKILKTLAQNPLKTTELLKSNPDISPYTLYHVLGWLKNHQYIQKKDEQWGLQKDYFNQLSVPDLAKIIDLRHKGLRRRSALSMKDLEMATYLWPKYERARNLEGLHAQPSSYGRRYQNHFALARAAKEWERGKVNTPQWALIAIADLTDLDIEEREVIASYSLPPGVKIVPNYKGQYKIPIELTSDFDALALQILLKSSNDGIVHPAKYKKALFKRLHYAFGSFQSNRIPLSIRELLEYYYQIPCCNRNSFRLPARMKKRWAGLSDHEKKIAQILVLEMLFDLGQSRRTYEIISRSKDLLDDVSDIMNDLGIGTITIHKRKDRPHYRSYLPRTVKENLIELKENVGKSKIEKRVDFLVETEREALIRKVKNYWGDTCVDIISNVTLDKGTRDMDLARASGIKPQVVRKILYELREQGIVTDIREETPELVEYYYYLCPDGIKKFLVEEQSPVKTDSEKEVTYPFPEDFTVYQRRRLFSEVR
jgi:DNA-binding HxlR family transcriptional regulator